VGRSGFGECPAHQYHLPDLNMRKMSAPLIRLLVVGTLILVAACKPRYLFEQTHSLPNTTWDYADTLRFSFDIPDTTQRYDLLVAIEHSTDYSWQNLYTRIHTVFPDGQRLNKPISFELSNELGLWQGKCSSRTCRLELPIQQNTYFNQPGRYTILLEQFMRETPITGIQSISLKIRQTPL
jgi:gliding motility-associated lipoprotein GldH